MSRSIRRVWAVGAQTTEADSPALGLLVAVLVVLPLANAHVGFPYVTSRLPDDETSWIVHRVGLIGAHAVLVLAVATWSRRSGFSLQLAEGSFLGTGILGLLTVAAGVIVVQKPLDAQLDLIDFGSFSRSAQLLSVTSIIWAGLGQEILFRAFALSLVESITGSALSAVVVTSISFGYYHGGTSLGVGNLLLNVVGGALLASLFLVTRSTWAVALPHAALVALLLALA